MEIIIACPMCGREHEVTLTNAEARKMHKWENRELLIQNALPKRSAYERELIRYWWSGLPMISCCEECYKENWEIDEDDEDDDTPEDVKEWEMACVVL